MAELQLCLAECVAYLILSNLKDFQVSGKLCSVFRS